MNLRAILKTSRRSLLLALGAVAFIAAFV